MIRRAVWGDLESVLRINAQARPGVAALDHAELERLLGIGAMLTVAEDLGTVSGYLLSFRYGAAYDGEEFRYLQQHLSEKFLYIDQVAVDARSQRRGLASALYRSLFDHAAEFGAFCCEVNLDPPNDGSMAFHQRLGFRAIRELKVRDGRSVALLNLGPELLQQ
jgi:predicted GNAT superfamily acetyltransferase